MTRSLAEDLRTLAQTGPTDPGAAIADRAGLMVRAIRRRRAARQTGMSAVGVSAAAAVMLGATNGPGWMRVGPAGSDDPSGLSTAQAPTAEPSPEPTDGPTDATTEPTPRPTADPVTDPDGVVPENGVALVAELYGLDLSCGAAFTRDIQLEAGASFADHLTPRFDVVPTAPDQPVRLVNEIGRDAPGPIEGGWARMTQAVVVTADGVVVGFGGGALQSGEPTAIDQAFVVDLPALAMCPTPPAGTVYTVYGISSEAGFDAVPRTEPATADEEHLNVSYGLSIDLATGEQWYGEPGERESALATDLVPMP